MKNILGIACIIVLFSGNVFGYCYQVTADSKIVNKSTQAWQLVVCCGDYHLKTHPANKDQLIYIESLLKRFKGKKVKCIVEDLSSVNNDGRMVCCNFGINCSEGVLGQLANKARACGIAVDNVEYRYCRVAGIGPLLSNIKAHPQTFRSSATISMTSLHKEVMDEIEKIKKYNDGKLLNDCYKHAASSVHAALSKMPVLRPVRHSFNDGGSLGEGGNVKHTMTVAEYCIPLQRKSYRQELEKLCIFDSALIDMNIVHSIATSPEFPLILVFAGGSHVEQVSSLLKKVGYESLLKTSVVTVPAVKKVLNSDSDDAVTEVHPEPVDMKIIDKLLHNF